MMLSSQQDRWKRAAAAGAVEEVDDGMVLGLGSGSTAAFVIEALAERIAERLRIIGIPSSDATAALAQRLGVPLTTFAEHRLIDVTIDGADQVERGDVQPRQGSWRCAAARKDSGMRQRPDDRRCRRDKARARSRKVDTGLRRP